MRKKKILLALFLTAACLAGTAQTFTNPVYDMADPFVTYHNGYYYATGTTGCTIGIKKSATLEGLKSAGTTHMVSCGTDGNPAGGWWASELHFLDGKWYCYFTGDCYDDAHRVYAYVNGNDDPTTGTWTNLGKVTDSANDYWEIDGTVFEYKGNRYFVYAGSQPLGIYINRMENPYTLVPGRTCVSTPSKDYELIDGTVNEGPEVLVHDNRVFIVYSTNGCWGPYYQLAMVSLAEGGDPMNAAAWTKADSPVFTGDAAAGAIAPGHHCFLKSPDGTEDWFIYHATPKTAGGCDEYRTPRAQRIRWNADGTPDFGTPIQGGTLMAAPSGEAPTAKGGVLPNGVYKIVCRATSQVLDLAGCSQELGTNIQQYADLDNDCQKWNVHATPEGYYTLCAVAGGLPMEVVGASSDNGANVQTYAPNGGWCQQWRIESVGDGYYKVISRSSGKVLDINTTTGNLQQYDWLGGENQQFQFQATAYPPEPEEGFTSWESYNMHGQYIRHAYGVGRIDKGITNDDYYWQMIPGLAGEGVSFRSKTYGNNYLRHKNGQLYLEAIDGTDLFNQDATFLVRSGLADDQYVSFESHNMPGRYIRHRDSQLYVEEVSSGLGYQDANFIGIKPGYTHGNDIITAYDGISFGDLSHGLPEGRFDFPELFNRNMTGLSSIRLPKGFRVTLYKNEGFSGETVSFLGNADYVGDTFNDAVKSIVVEPCGVSGLDGTYKVEGRNSQLMWDMDGNGDGNDTKLVQWTDEGLDEAYQFFRLTELEKGVYRIHNLGSPDRVLEVYGAGKGNASAVQIYDNLNGAHQQFIAYQPEEGWYQWVARNSGRVIEVPYNYTDAGVKLQIYDNNDQYCSFWRLVPDQYTGVAETSCSGEVTLYPSPADGFIHVTLSGNTASHCIRIVTLTGKTIGAWTSTAADITLDVSALSPGLYLLQADGQCVKWTKR